MKPEYLKRNCHRPASLGVLLTACMGLLAWASVAPAVIAQGLAQGFSFTVSPLLVELQGPPGSTQSFDIAIVSADTARPAEFEVVVKPLVQDLSGNYRLAPVDAKGEHSAVDWIKVTPQTFRVEPGKSTLVRGELTFPRQFRGGAYAAVVLSLKPEEGESEGPRQLIRNEFVVVVEAVALAQGVRPDVYIKNQSVLSVTQKGLEQYAKTYGPNALIFVAEVANEGNVHAFVSGSVSIWDAQGRKLSQFPLGSGRGAVLPAATVQLGSVLTKGLPPGEYTLQAVVNYGGSRPAVSRHKFVVGETLLQQPQGGRGVRIVVDPEIVSLELNAGGSKFVALRLQNMDKVPIQVSAQVLPLVYDAGGNPNVEDVQVEGASDDWTSVRPQDLTIAPGTSRNIQIGVRVPRDAATGGHYAQIILTARPAGSEPGGSETVLTVPVYVVLGRNLPVEGDLTPLDIKESEDRRFLILSTVFTNRGKVHVTPSAEITMALKTIPQTADGTEFVGDPIWGEVAKLNVPPSTNPILPGGTRNLGAIIAKPEKPGEYRIRVVVRFGSATALVQEALVGISEDGIHVITDVSDSGGDNL